MKGSEGNYGAGLKGHCNSWRSPLENKWVAPWCGERALRVVQRVYTGIYDAARGPQTDMERPYCNQFDQK